MSLKVPTGSENKTLKDSEGLMYQGGVPLDRQGANGDWWSRDAGGTGTSRNAPPVVYGPKAGGTWNTEFKRVMPNAPRYTADAKSIAALGIGPVALGLAVIENIGETPTANPFTAVSGSWTNSGAGTFHSSNRATTAIAVMASVPVPSYSNPPPLTQFGLVTVSTLPSATDGANGAVGVGSLHPTAAGYGYAVWADKDGRFCLGKWDAGLNVGAGSYLTATGTGVVTAGRKVAFLRIGSYIQGFVFTNTGVLVAGSTLAVTMDASFDGAFASGPAVFAHRTQDSRLSYFYGLT